MNFKMLNNEQRPRERLIKYGANSLSDYELLAIMLGSGSKKLNVIELSIMLINKYGIGKLLRMNYYELKKINGIKEAKATKLMACFELAKRCIKNEYNKTSIQTACELFNYVKNDFLFLMEENVMVVFVDVKCRVVFKKMYSDKDISMVTLPIRNIIKDGIDLASYGLFLIHNHPSGDVAPSSNDIQSTLRLKQILNAVNLVLLDHLIISDNEYFSFEENDILK